MTRGRGVAAPDTSLVIAAVLAVVAGCIDAICFGRVFDVFPANQSGNAVLLGIALGKGSAGEAWRPAVAILGFAVGIVGAVLLGSRVRGRRRAELLLVLEVLLLLPLALALTGTTRPAAELDGALAGLLLLSTAAGMGIQTEVIGRVAGVTIATTYQSGAIAGIAEATAGRVTSHDDTDTGTVARSRLRVLGVVLIAYIAGAALGSALGDWSGALLVPTMIVVVVCAVLAVAAYHERMHVR